MYKRNVSSPEDLEKVISMDGEKLLILDFYADWCSPCQRMLAIFEQMTGNEDDGVVLVKINTDENRELVQKYNIKSIPTMIFMKKGFIVNRISGAISKSVLEKEIEIRKQ